MSDQVKITNASATSAVQIGNGYMLKKGDNVAAFYADQIGDSLRAYPLATSTAFSVVAGVTRKIPSVILEPVDDDDDDDFEAQEISFPEFEGWDVHCVSGGKILSICLTKD